MQRFIVLMIMITGFSCIFWTCKDGPTKPKDDTQDTTSHNFSWTITRLGDGAGSILHDCVIINDTLAYAVGEIYLKDSLGNWDPTVYNFAQWNGYTWTISNKASNAALLAICAFSPNDIWVGTGGPYHWDGTSWHSYNITGAFSGSVAKFWGTNSNDLYMVGTNGSIAHYNGSSWTKIESGTTLSLNDIYGAYNSSTSQWEILAVASSSQTTENKLLQIQSNNTVTVLDTSGLSPFSTGLWFAPSQRYYIVGDGIHQKSLLSDPTWKVYPQGEITNYASSAIYGQGLNDVFIAGSFCEVAHFNGSTWYNYRSEIPNANGALGGIAVKGNTAVIVGYIDQQAVAIIGKR